MDILEAIRTRYSTRAFLDKPVPRETIEAILDVARQAPSGGNTQPWEVAVVTGRTKRRIGEAIISARDSGIPDNADYAYYPARWEEPYNARRKACGLALYRALGIGRDDAAARKEAWYRNYHFFGAPVGLLFFIDARLAKGSWVDMGMFIQTVMLAAQGHGLGTCPQAALAEYPDIVREILGISADKHLICGVALGYEDPAAPINGYRTERDPVSGFTTWHD